MFQGSHSVGGVSPLIRDECSFLLRAGWKCRGIRWINHGPLPQSSCCFGWGLTLPMHINSQNGSHVKKNANARAFWTQCFMGLALRPSLSGIQLNSSRLSQLAIQTIYGILGYPIFRHRRNVVSQQAPREVPARLFGQTVGGGHGQRDLPFHSREESTARGIRKAQQGARLLITIHNVS